MRITKRSLPSTTCLGLAIGGGVMLPGPAGPCGLTGANAIGIGATYAACQPCNLYAALIPCNPCNPGAARK